MKTEKNILIAFILNLCFSVFEFFGGVFTGSVAILSDAVHDIGDAASIGLSLFFERKSKKAPDKDYTYGYRRYSVIGGVITTVILLFGSAAVVYNAVLKILHPTEINYNGMIVFAVIGVLVNFLAAYVTREGDSVNQRAVNLHMLEDVLGWVVVLVGAVVMRFTDFYIIDPIMSIAVALFIFVNAVKNLREIVYLFLEKTPDGIDIEHLKEELCELEGVVDAHHIHVWSLDGGANYATMHIVTNDEGSDIKKRVRAFLKEEGICHATLELEKEGENCESTECAVHAHSHMHGHHHHHHHH